MIKHNMGVQVPCRNEKANFVTVQYRSFPGLVIDHQAAGNAKRDGSPEQSFYNHTALAMAAGVTGRFTVNLRNHHQFIPTPAGLAAGRVAEPLVHTAV